MKRRIIVIGLDCLGPDILMPDMLSMLPAFSRLVERSTSGILRSVLPPITIPAWTCMMTGRDPGELGIYGFRNRRTYKYEDFGYSTTQSVRFPRLWDYVGKSGGKSIVIGMPQTFPPPRIAGWLVSGFEVDKSIIEKGLSYTYPSDMQKEIQQTVGEYLFDLKNFRNIPLEEVVEQVFLMTEKHFQVMEYLLKTKEWDCAVLCEIGPDRIHHCFWRYHDPNHPGHISHSTHGSTIRDYYQFLDKKISNLFPFMDEETVLLIASDHGAQSMHGGVAINEILIKENWLVLHEEPQTPQALDYKNIDWAKTKAWGEGGYYSRIFLNIRGREPEGIIHFKDRDNKRQELTDLLKTIDLPEGPTLQNQVIWPEKWYRRTRGLPPDLMVFFGGMQWRSIGTVGNGKTWLIGNDTGVDGANHKVEGLFILTGPGIPVQKHQEASILDILPTLLYFANITIPKDIQGENILNKIVLNV